MNIPSIPNVKGLATLAKTFVLANRPELLFGASVAATLGSVVLAAKGGYEARGKVDEAEREQGRPLDTKEKINLTWLCYMPAAVTTIGAVGATTGLHLVHVSEKKALVQTALGAIEEVKDAAREFEEERNGALAANSDKNGVAKIENSDGEIEEMYLVRDAHTGRDIWSNQHRIEDAVIEVNNVLNGSGDCELNHFYRHAGFNNIPDGIKMGWSGALLSIEWNHTQRDDGRPVREFTFRPSPTVGYDDHHA